jgi:hypothetical protein
LLHRLIATTWTNQDGWAAPLTAKDVMVVAPYNRVGCLAYLVYTERLLNGHARSVDEMSLISTFRAFVEYCDT